MILADVAAVFVSEAVSGSDRRTSSLGLFLSAPEMQVPVVKASIESKLSLRRRIGLVLFSPFTRVWANGPLSGRAALTISSSSDD